MSNQTAAALAALPAATKRYMKSVTGRAAFNSACNTYASYGFDRAAYACICALQYLHYTGRLDAPQDLWCREQNLFTLLAKVAQLLAVRPAGCEGDYQQDWQAALTKLAGKQAKTLTGVGIGYAA